ncbi:hypothetical protein CEXT_751221 [Caerostris extrusa]|uniref:Uncharacterized protein n=1 Tax=Caerostris extrusa TaxID=172846 RepID=A0AAV4W311_CAEEX|nr:hypothetical protein CEXT_751221 [Caerostris extrusa]
MATLKVNDSSAKKIYVENVLEELEKQNYVNETFDEMLTYIRNRPSYKRMKQVAVAHMTNKLKSSSGTPDEGDCDETRKQMKEVSNLVLSLYNSANKVISDTLEHKTKNAITKALKRLDKQTSTTKLTNNRTAKRKHLNLSECVDKRSQKRKNSKVDDCDSEFSRSSFPADGKSDISSIDNLIVVSEDEELESRNSLDICDQMSEDSHSNVHFIALKKEKGVKEKRPHLFLTMLRGFIINEDLAGTLSSTSTKSTERMKRERKPSTKYFSSDYTVK